MSYNQREIIGGGECTLCEGFDERSIDGRGQLNFKFIDGTTSPPNWSTLWSAFKIELQKQDKL